MVDDRTSAKSLNDKVFLIDTPIVSDGYLDDTLLDEEHFIGELPSFTNEGSFLIGESFESVDYLLLRVQTEFLEVVDFVHFDGDPSRQLILVLENLLLKTASQRLKGLRKLLKVRLSEKCQCTIVL